MSRKGGYFQTRREKDKMVRIFDVRLTPMPPPLSSGERGFRSAFKAPSLPVRWEGRGRERGVGGVRA